MGKSVGGEVLIHLGLRNPISRWLRPVASHMRGKPWAFTTYHALFIDRVLCIIPTTCMSSVLAPAVSHLGDQVNTIE